MFACDNRPMLFVLCVMLATLFFFFFFFNDTATTEIYTLSLHDALPILTLISMMFMITMPPTMIPIATTAGTTVRSEEHTSELQSQSNLVCRLLLEKKKKQQYSSSSLPPYTAPRTTPPTHTRIMSRTHRT